MSWGNYLFLMLVFAGCLPMLIGVARRKVSVKAMFVAMGSSCIGAIGLFVVQAVLTGNQLFWVPLFGLVPMTVLAFINTWLTFRSRELEGEARQEIEKIRDRLVTWLVQFVIITVVLAVVPLLAPSF